MDQPVREQIVGKSPSSSGRPRILVAPLDWGLGHATRCIPLIHLLLEQNAEVIIATDGPQAVLLQTEFPGLQVLALEGYNAKYSSSARGMTWQMLIQTPKFIRSIQNEKKWLQTIIAEQQIDAVISDNRYGLSATTIPCIFITHQLQIKSPLGKLTERIIQSRNYRYINSFSECWVPDTSGNGLGGELSHPAHKPAVPLKYMGPLSRFKKTNTPVSNNHLLFILSGPEPQRSILENKLIPQISRYGGTVTVVRGLPGNASLIPSTNMIRFYNHLPSAELNEEIEKAEYVISRSGYSTIMDLATLQKKSILIPTPGQTEQEYLAAYLYQQQFALTVAQKNFVLAKHLEAARNFTYKFPELTTDATPFIKQLLASLKQ
jgi:uncharacterized protein (TIGR00661 family)